MEESGISDQVKQFLDEHISSVGQLEILLLLQTNPRQKWTAAAIARELRTETPGAQQQLDLLLQGEMITGDQAAGYCYARARINFMRRRRRWRRRT